MIKNLQKSPTLTGLNPILYRYPTCNKIQLTLFLSILTSFELVELFRLKWNPFLKESIENRLVFGVELDSDFVASFPVILYFRQVHKLKNNRETKIYRTAKW